MTHLTERLTHCGRVTGMSSGGPARAAFWLVACGFLGLAGTAQAQTLTENLPGSLSGTYSASILSNCSGTVSPATCARVTLGSNANVTLMGGSEIVLGPGFTAIGSSTSSLVAEIGVPPPSFALTLTPGLPIMAWVPNSGTYTVTVSPLNGFSGTVSFAALLPSGFTAAFSPTTVTGSGHTTMTITAQTGFGNYPFTVTGTSGTLIQTASTTLSVEDFTVTLSPSTQQVVGTTPQVVSLTLTATSLGGFNQSISVGTVTGTAVYNGWSVAKGCSGLTLAVASCNTATLQFDYYYGTDNEIVTVGGGGITHTASATLTAAPLQSQTGLVPIFETTS
jgi:hypothetical protein